MKKPKPNNSQPISVAIKRLAHAAELPFPAYQSKAAAGVDLIAAIDAHHPVQLTPGARVLVPTGLIIELPEGFEAQVRPRSGLAVRHGVTVLNSPGTIDADYRGEIKVILINHGGAAFDIRRGERIAQLVIAPVSTANLVEVEDVSETERGEAGFGSTGTNAPPESKPPSGQKAPSKSRKPATKKSAKPSATKKKSRSNKAKSTKSRA